MEEVVSVSTFVKVEISFKVIGKSSEKQSSMVVGNSLGFSIKSDNRWPFKEIPQCNTAHVFVFQNIALTAFETKQRQSGLHLEDENADFGRFACLHDKPPIELREC